MKRWIRLAAVLCLLAVLAGCRHEKQIELVWQMEAQDVLTLPDGESVDAWRSRSVPVNSGDETLPSNAVDYRLSDGTELLREKDLPDVELPEDTPDTARKAIRNYYTEQGRLYDVKELLQAACTAWQADKKHFSEWYVEQSTYTTAQNDSLLWLCTEQDLPIASQEMTTTYTSVVFDRATGEPVDVWSLFRVPEEEAKAALLRTVQDDTERAALLQALKPEWILFYPDHVEVSFPAGSVEGENTDLKVAADLSELTDILQTWAVPQAETTEE